MVLIARCQSSTIASKDMSSCVIGWILTKLTRMILIWPSTINCLNGFSPLYICIKLKWAKIDFQAENFQNTQGIEP